MIKRHICGSLISLMFTVGITGNAFATEGPGSPPAPILPNISINNPSSAAATSGANATANPVTNVTANPVVSPVISPIITGGNSAANVGNVTAGGATLNGTVSGAVNSANTNNLQATTGNNTNTLNGGTSQATGTANVNVGGQVLYNTSTGGAGGQGGEGGKANSTSNSGSSSSSKVENSGNSDSRSASSSSSQGGNVKDVGNVSGSGNSSVSINNPKPLPPAAQIPHVQANAPTLLFNEGKPANATAVRLAIEFLKGCPPSFSETDVSEIREKGTSSLTRAIFTPHSNYAEYKKSGVASRVQVVMTPEQLPLGKFKCTCLGLLQVEAYTSDASEVTIQTVINDAGIFARDKMNGYADVKLVLIPAHSVSINMGADANASGFGIAPGFSGLLNAVLGTIGANASRNSGRTFPAAQLGATFAVVAGGDIPPGAISIDLGTFMTALSTHK